MNTTLARDEIFEMLRQAWEDQAGAVVNGAVPPVLWQGQEQDGPFPQGETYARATVMHSTRGQASLGDAGGERRWRNAGVIIVQCFGPLSSGKGLTIAEAL